jgi:uncharacterized membrane protein
MSGWRVALEFLSLFLAGLLAGEELVVRYGIRGPLASLDESSHIQCRQALILRLRILVPCLFLAAAVTSILTVLALGGGPGAGYRIAATTMFVVWVVLTAFGTVPINSAALEWSTTDPPPDWRATVDRWERMNTARTGLAVAAFALLVVAAGLTNVA